MSSHRVALVTGSGKRRVGSFVAEALARQGYAIAVHYHRSAGPAAEQVARCQSHGPPAIAVAADLRDDAAVRRMFDTVDQSFSRLDVIVNCAAIWEPIRLEQITAEDVRRNFEVNTLGTFLCCQLGGLRMVEQATGGVIVNLGDWAIARPYLNYAAYFPSKGAITALTRSMAVELGTRNPRVRVNCILPGPVMLPPDLPAAERQHSIAGTLVKREGSPDNVAQAVLACIDNDFLTGVCLPVDGGRSIYAAD